MSFGRFAALAAWAALVTATVELVMRVVQKFGLHRYIYLGRDVVWMTPLADLALFALVAVLLGLGSLAAPRLASLRVAGSVFGFLAAFSVLTLQPWMAWWAMAVLAVAFGYRVGTLAAEREAAFWRVVRLSLPVLLVVFAILGLGFRAGVALVERRTLAAAPAPQPGAPNVLMIVWDAVRARSLSLHGYERNTSPRLSALAAGGTMFERAISTAPYTLPTHGSLFTGLWAHQQSSTWTVPLDDVPPTLAGALGAHGYRTGLFSANHILVTWESGLLRDFSHAEDHTFSPGELARSSALLKWLLAIDRLRDVVGWYDTPGRRDAADIRTSFLRWLDGGDKDRPFFAFLNVYDAHRPYLPPAPFDTLFGLPAGAGPAERRQVRAQSITSPSELAPDEVVRQRDQYDGAIAEIDQDLGRILEELRQRGLLENTLVVVAGDHGEAFGEHGAFEHGNDVYLEEVHVPLVMALPGRVPAGVRVPGVVSLRDVPATIGQVLGLAGPSWPLPGNSLARLWEIPPGGPVASDTVLAEVDQIPRGSKEWYPVRRGNVRSILAWPWHLITVAGDVELYQLEADPGQHRNLAEDPPHGAIRDSLVTALQRWRRDAVPGKR